MEIDLYSTNGQLIERIYQGEYTQTINYLCTRLENGIYLVRLTTDKGKVYSKLLIVYKG